MSYFQVLLFSFLFNLSLGCQDNPVGIADSSIVPDSSFTATSYYDSRYAAKNGRLNGVKGWGPKTSTKPNDYLQIDLLEVFTICAVATQGLSDGDEWTTKYNISTSFDNNTWTTYGDAASAKVFTGNTDRNTVVKNALYPPVLAKFIRFIPTTYFGWKVLRVEVYGLKKGWKDKVKLSDVSVLTLRQGQMTNGRRSAPVPQMTCVGGSAGCSSFVPKVVQCYNRGSDGYDFQWECKTDMDNNFRFGENDVNCEGYDYPEDPYILKGSCWLEYTIDYVGGKSGNSYHSSYHSGDESRHHNSYNGNYGHKKHWKHSYWLSTLIMLGIIACITYYIYSTCSSNQHTTGGTQYASNQSASAPPPPGFRPEYTQDQSTSYTTNTGSSSADSSSGYGGFWSGLGAGGLAGYLFGSSRGYGNTGYYHRSPYYHQGYNGGYGGYGGYGNSWFGGGNSWFGGNSGNSGWFSSSGSTFGSTHRRSSPSSSSSGSRTASGFGGTKRR